MRSLSPGPRKKPRFKKTESILRKSIPGGWLHLVLTTGTEKSGCSSDKLNDIRKGGPLQVRLFPSGGIFYFVVPILRG